MVFWVWHSLAKDNPSTIPDMRYLVEKYPNGYEGPHERKAETWDVCATRHNANSSRVNDCAEDFDVLGDKFKFDHRFNCCQTRLSVRLGQRDILLTYCARRAFSDDPLPKLVPGPAREPTGEATKEHTLVSQSTISAVSILRRQTPYWPESNLTGKRKYSISQLCGASRMLED